MKADATIFASLNNVSYWNTTERMHGRNLALGPHVGPNFPEQFYSKSSGKPCHEVITISNEANISSSFMTGKMAYYILSSILAVGILVIDWPSGSCHPCLTVYHSFTLHQMLVIIPIGSTFLYIDCKYILQWHSVNSSENGTWAIVKVVKRRAIYSDFIFCRL